MKELMLIQAELNVPKGQTNKFGGYRYRSSEDILSALKPLLSKNECTLTITDDMVAILDRVYVKSTILLKNKSGEEVSVSAFARESLTKKGMDDSQITGSTSSYSRKYGLNGMFAIDDTADADATNTHGKGDKPAPPNKPANKITPDQTIKINDLASKAGLTEEHKKKANDFANNKNTTETQASSFIIKLQGMVDKAKHSKKTPKEKLIDDLIETSMSKWESDDEDNTVSQLLVKLKTNSLSNATIDAMTKLKAGIEDGTVVPF